MHGKFMSKEDCIKKNNYRKMVIVNRSLVLKVCSSASASALPRNLFEMKIPGPHPRPIESDTLAKGPNTLY